MDTAEESSLNHFQLKTKKCLVITGKAGAGKDTVADMIYDLHTSPRPRAFRFSAPLKRVVSDVFGWSELALNLAAYKEARLDNPLYRHDGTEMNTRREVLQYVGTEVFRRMDSQCWVNAALRYAAAQASLFDTNGFICTDCRFPNELEALEKHFGDVMVVRLVKVGGFHLDGPASSHASESLELPYEKAFTLDAGDFDGLKAVAVQLSQFFVPKEAA